jgi:hypothetical protein
VARIVLIAAAFLVGTGAAGLLLGLVTWNQNVVDVGGGSAGIASAVLVAFKTRSLTQTESFRQERAKKDSTRQMWQSPP